MLWYDFKRLPSLRFAGAYPNEVEAAQAHDLAALKYWGLEVYTNFPVCDVNAVLILLKDLFVNLLIVLDCSRQLHLASGNELYLTISLYYTIPITLQLEGVITTIHWPFFSLISMAGLVIYKFLSVPIQGSFEPETLNGFSYLSFIRQK